MRKRRKLGILLGITVLLLVAIASGMHIAKINKKSTIYDVDKITLNDVENGDIVIQVGTEELTKEEVKQAEKAINYLKKGNMKLTAIEKDPIDQAIRRKISLKEADERNIVMSEQRVKDFTEVATGMYENTDKTQNREEYIEYMTQKQLDDERETLFLTEIQMDIVQGKFECNDPTVQRKLKEFKIVHTGSKLGEICLSLIHI